MKLNDLNEAPMGLLKKMGHKVLSKVPGSIGSKSQGKLDTGRVANYWKQQYMQFLGQTGEKIPSTESLLRFLQTKGLQPEDLTDVVKESSVVYERALTNREVDAMMLKAAQIRAGQGVGGRVEPTLSPPGPGTSPTQGSAPQAAPQAAPVPRSMPNLTSKSATQAPSTKPAADPNALKTDAAGGYVRKWANDLANAGTKAEKIALAKEMMAFLSDRKGSPEGARLANAVAAIAKKSTDPVLAKMLKNVRGLRMTRENYMIARDLLSEAGLTFKDLGMKVLISESTIDYVVIACH